MTQYSDLQKSYHGIAARLDRLPIGKVQKKTLFILGGVIFCDSIDMSIGGPVIAQLLSTGWSDSGLNALFVSITMVGYLFGGLLSGVISDGIGRKKAALTLCALFSAGCLVGAAAPNMYFLIGCRFIMGLGLGGRISMLLLYSVRIHPIEEAWPVASLHCSGCKFRHSRWCVSVHGDSADDWLACNLPVLRFARCCVFHSDSQIC